VKLVEDPVCIAAHIGTGVSRRKVRISRINAPDTSAIVDTLAWFRSIRLLSELESRIVESLFKPCFEFAEAVKLAESIHLHIKVEDTETLPFDEFVQHGGTRASSRVGYGKYYFPDGLNLIFSTIPIAQDDLRETEDFKRPRPFLDHIGIDLREESDIVRAGFKKLSNRADELGWGHIAQGGKGRPVYCCHIEVAEKRWIYPPPRPNGCGIPLEFAFGPLKMNDSKAGCDLRPSMPALREAFAPTPQCCVP
jgi:hypothetical protein